MKFEVRSFKDPKHIIWAKIKKTSHVTLHDHAHERVRKICHRMPSTSIFYPHTKFAGCRFSPSEDIISGVEIEKGLRDPDNAPSEVVCHLWARI